MEAPNRGLPHGHHSQPLSPSLFSLSLSLEPPSLSVSFSGEGHRCHSIPSRPHPSSFSRTPSVPLSLSRRAHGQLAISMLWPLSSHTGQSVVLRGGRLGGVQLLDSPIAVVGSGRSLVGGHGEMTANRRSLVSFDDQVPLDLLNKIVSSIPNESS